ncbi:MAG: hypothetical protein U0165_07550 [Polyangiaceae bacterium]
MTEMHAVVLALYLVAWLVWASRRRWVAAIAITAFVLSEAFSIHEGTPRGVLRVTHLDVGQETPR